MSASLITMKYAYRIIAIFLLLTTFTVKIAVPVCNNYKSFTKADTEQQQEENASEEDGKLAPKDKFEVAEIMLSYHYLPQQNPDVIHRLLLSHSFLPVQYFAVPTPPPWHKS